MKYLEFSPSPGFDLFVSRYVFMERRIVRQLSEIKFRMIQRSVFCCIGD